MLLVNRGRRMAAIFTLFGKARETTIVSIAMLESERRIKPIRILPALGNAR